MLSEKSLTLTQLTTDGLAHQCCILRADETIIFTGGHAEKPRNEAKHQS
jgi:predicted house-cleaning NTP pyrophosphatase (Maf/HAM1 superfamily)